MIVFISEHKKSFYHLKKPNQFSEFRKDLVIIIKSQIYTIIKYKCLHL